MGILSLGALLGCSTTNEVRQARGTRVTCSVLPALGIILVVVAAPTFGAVESEARGNTARAHVEGVAESHILIPFAASRAGRSAAPSERPLGALVVMMGMIGMAVLLYFLPPMVAALRGHENTLAIFVLTLLQGGVLLAGSPRSCGRARPFTVPTAAVKPSRLELRLDWCHSIARQFHVARLGDDDDRQPQRLPAIALLGGQRNGRGWCECSKDLLNWKGPDALSSLASTTTIQEDNLAEHCHTETSFLTFAVR